MPLRPRDDMPPPPDDIADLPERRLPPNEYAERAKAWLDWAQRAENFAQQMLQKALDEGAIEIEDGTMSELVKAIRRGERPIEQPYKIVQGLLANNLYRGISDPWSVTGVSFIGLRRMAMNPIIRVIHETRILDFASFCRAPRYSGDKGFRIVLADEARRPTLAERKEMQAIERFLHNCAIYRPRRADGIWGYWDPDEVREALPFGLLNRVLARDSLTLDAAALRIHAGQKSPVAYLEADDAALIRRVVPKYPTERLMQPVEEDISYQPTLRREIQPAYVMVDEQGRVLREYANDELGYWIRNPRSDVWSNGYGYSELETLLNIVMGLELGIRFNISFFTENHIPPGLLLLKGGVVREDIIEDFLTTIIGQTAGTGRWWKTPIWWTSDPHGDVNFVPLRQQQGMDMMWREWIILLLNIAAALYNMAAEKIGFQAFLTRGGQLTGEGGAERVAEAQATGLRALLYASEDFWNRNVIARFGERDEYGFGPYRLRYEGVDELAERDKYIILGQKVGAGLATLNEIRVSDDLPPYYDPLNRNLWDKIAQRVDREAPHLRSLPQERLELIAELYTKAGGKLAKWPDLPLYQGAIMLMQMEHQEQTGEPAYGPNPREMSGGGAAEGATGGEEEEEEGGGAMPEALPAGLALAKALSEGRARVLRVKLRE